MDDRSVSEARREAFPAPETVFTRADYARLFLPLIAEQSLIQVVALASSFMVARAGAAAVSGVSLVENVMALFFTVFSTIASGGIVVAGSHLGRGERHRARIAADQLVRLTVLVGMGFTFLFLLGKDLVLDGLFGAIGPDVRGAADAYLSIVAFSLPAMALYNADAAVFRAGGDSRLPLIASLAMGVVNVLGAAYAVLVLDAGVAGVAWASLLSRWVSAGILLLHALRKSFPLATYPTLLVPLKRRFVTNILSIGVPFGIEGALFHVGRLSVLSVVATYGTAAIAANAVAGTVCLMNVIPGMAISMGMPAVIARFTGVRDYAGARWHTRRIMLLSTVVELASAVCILVLLEPILELYALPAEATDIAREIILWHLVLSVLLWPASFILPVTMRSSGDASFAMWAGIVSMFGVRVVFCWVLGTWLGMGTFGTWLALFLDWVVRSAVFIWRYLGTRWQKARI